MKHLVIGVGTVGKATGHWLEANREDVWYYDINSFKLKDIERTVNTPTDESFDIIWICTNEKNLIDVLEYFIGSKKIIIVRSTTIPGTCKHNAPFFNIKNLLHVPEFLKAESALQDIFFPSRVVIGELSKGTECAPIVANLYKKFIKATCPIMITDTVTSEMIKLASNNWLFMQVVYWNDIKKVCEGLGINPQEVANGCTLDERISIYGSKMTGGTAGGVCLPKDMNQLIELCKRLDLTNTTLFEDIKRINDYLGDIVE